MVSSSLRAAGEILCSKCRAAKERPMVPAPINVIRNGSPCDIVACRCFLGVGPPPSGYAKNCFNDTCARVKFNERYIALLIGYETLSQTES